MPFLPSPAGAIGLALYRDGDNWRCAPRGPERLLGFNEEEHPLALQLGGSDPADLARCARIAQARGYDEVNLNVGCPSDRVQRGRFGACLMLEPLLVRDCLAAMRDAVDIPVTVKTRLGVDDQYSYECFSDFVGYVGQSGVTFLSCMLEKPGCPASARKRTGTFLSCVTTGLPG